MKKSNFGAVHRFRRVQRLSAMAVTTLVVFISFLCRGTTYYVHPVVGDDNNAGTSEQRPWKTLERAGKVRLRPGDQLLLAAGEMFQGQVSYDGLAGEATHPVVIGSYRLAGSAGAASAAIDARGYAAGVQLKNCSHVEVRDLAITANGGGCKRSELGKLTLRCGVLVEVDQPGQYDGFCLTNLSIQDVFYEEPGFVRDPTEVNTANGTQYYGWGIRFLVTSPGANLRDIAIVDCQVANVSHTGLKLTAPSNSIQQVRVQRLRVGASGGPGVQMAGVRGGRFSGLYVNGSGSTNDSRNWKRGSGLWTWGSSDVLIEKSQFLNANGPADSAGVHIDYNCRNVVVQYNLSANNAGGFCEILGNNYNCAYRYNVSINDGYRVKGLNGAFQEGKTFWLSGYVGNGHRRGPFNTYFYNNTIYARADLVAKIAVAPTAEGVLIANNIFCLRGGSQAVAGDQFRADVRSGGALRHVVFENNLYLHPGNWPAELSIQDRSPRLGDPEFCNPGGLKLEDYLPRNGQLIRNRGIRISRIPQDNTGLTVGLEVERDILGQKIAGAPDLGAIEMP